MAWSEPLSTIRYDTEGVILKLFRCQFGLILELEHPHELLQCVVDRPDQGKAVHHGVYQGIPAILHARFHEHTE
jgi:hypothetical protein